MSSLPNGNYLLPPRTRRAVALRGRVKARLTKLAELPQVVKLASVLTLIVLAALLAGCATPSSPPSEGARNPLPPQIREPLPTESYLQRAQKLIESWQNAVTGM
jgi:hypothetical protein